MESIKKKFDAKVGLSDHTLGHSAAVAAVAHGAIYIEKHFILDKSINSADSTFSMTPEDFSQMVFEIRNTEKVLGDYNFSDHDENSRLHMRSVFTIKNIKKGDVFSAENIRVMRPNYGVHPKFFKQIIGSLAKNDIEKDQPLKASDF